MRTLITLLILSLTSCSDIFVGDYSKYPQYRHHYQQVNPVPVTEYLPGVGLITIYRYGNYVSVYNHSTGTYSNSLSGR